MAIPFRRLTRAGVVGVGVIVALVLTGKALTTPSTDFTASGDPRPLPPPAQLTRSSADEFEGILVGLRGTAVIVNVWASWCGPCRTEAPLLARAGREHADDLVILGVASKDSFGAAAEFMDEYGLDYPNVFDESGDIRQRLGLRGFPTTYVFDRDGVLVATVVGGISEQRLAAQIDDVTR